MLILFVCNFVFSLKMEKVEKVYCIVPDGRFTNEPNFTISGLLFHCSVDSKQAYQVPHPSFTISYVTFTEIYTYYWSGRISNTIAKNEPPVFPICTSFQLDNSQPEHAKVRKKIIFYTVK